MPPPSRPLCAEVSREIAEPLAATASRVDHWILVEYRGLWGYDAAASSGLPEPVKAHLRERAAALGRAKVLFIRRTERRGRRGLAVLWGASTERGARLSAAEVARYEDLHELDFAGAAGPPLERPLLLVCTHGKHDRCCARYGRPLYEALREAAEEGWVWQCTHIGGDRFAGNLIVLPEGLYFGRVEPADAWTVLDEYLAGRIHLERYRGRCCYPFPAQAAERLVRDELGLVGLDDLSLLGVERERQAWVVRFRAGARECQAWVVRFRAGARECAVDVVQEAGELTHLTCSAEALTHPRRFAARSLRVSAA